MQMPSSTASTGIRLRYSRTVAANVTADPKAHPLAKAVQKVHEALKAAQTAVNDAEDAVIDLRGFTNRELRLAGDTLSALQLDATVVVNRDYQDPLYRSLFQQGVPALRQLSAGALLPVLAALGDTLTALGKDHPLHKYAALLAAHSQALGARWADQQKAEQKLVTVRLARDTAATAWEQGLDSTYGALKQLFPRQKAVVEGFFPKLPKKVAKADAGVVVGPIGPAGQG